MAFTPIHSAGSKVFIDGFDMSCYFDKFDMEASQTMNNHTTFCNTAENFLPGLKSGKGTGECFLDDSVNVGSIAVLSARYGATPGAGIPAAVMKSHGIMAVGSPVDMAFFDTVSLQIKDLVADLQKLTFNGQSADKAIDFGRCLHALTAETTFPFSGTSVDNAASSANGGVGVVHCTGIGGAGPNAVVRIQHSTNNSTWIDLIVFSAITAANSVRRVEVAGMVNRYLRETITDAGTTSSFSGATAFARR